MGDPQQPQGFNPVKPRVLWPGDHLTVACDFDSSDKSVAVAAGPTHEHEMCNMYLMVHSALPHIEMCSDGFRMVDEASPGNMPRSAALLPDPYPLWKPPQAEDASGKVGRAGLLRCAELRCAMLRAQQGGARDATARHPFSPSHALAEPALPPPPPCAAVPAPHLHAPAAGRPRRRGVRGAGPRRHRVGAAPRRPRVGRQHVWRRRQDCIQGAD